MKIAMFSITPLFPQHDMGGAQKHLRLIAHHLADLGHEVILLCTRRADTPEQFQWHERITVKAILRFRQPFPGPYDTPAYNIANIIQDVTEHVDWADRFYIHDGEFVFPYVYHRKPTIVSLRDNVYPETIQGAFQFSAHRMVVISEYARQFFLNTVGRFFPDLPGRMLVIRNGLDFERFRPQTPSARIREIIPVDPEKHTIVLHPHRPEETKGIWQTIEVVDRLVHQYGMTDLRACVPLWLNVENDPGVSDFYDRVRALIAERGLTEHFVFHSWVPADLMPEYFSLGHVTLALGNFVESFGNAVYESLACGTRVVVARISSHRELLPEALNDKVDFNDHDEAAAKAAAVLRGKLRTSPETMAYLHTHYDKRDQLARFADVILNAELAQPMRFEPQPITDATRYRLASWCYLAKRGIYHDYKGDYLADDTLMALVQQHPDGFALGDAAPHAVTRDTLDHWQREGYIVPLRG